MELEMYCQACDVTGPHDVDGGEAVCQSCGTVREVDPEAMAGVVEMAFCDRCRETLPAGHPCFPDAPPCESRTHLGRCGMCPTDLALQERVLAAREQAVMGAPFDAHIP